MECGSGTTTLLIGGFLRRNGRGRLFSLEHDLAFAQSTQRQIDAAGLSEVCKVICAPLKPQPFGGELVSWYDLACLHELPEAIDLLGSGWTTGRQPLGALARARGVRPSPAPKRLDPRGRRPPARGASNRFPMASLPR